MADLSQLELLGLDYHEIARIIEQNPSFVAPLADLRDADRHARHLVLADLTFQVWQNAGAVQVLLNAEFYSASLVLVRTIFEAFATFLYLAHHSASQDEAIIFLAFSYLQQIEDFEHDKPFTDDLKRILSTMPPLLVATAEQRRSNRPYTWSGKTFRQLCAAAKVTGYEEAYPHLSANVHATLLGQHVRVTNPVDGKAHIQTGRRFSEKEIESAANFARRMLHTVIRTTWGIFGAPPVTLHTYDPMAWRLPKA